MSKRILIVDDSMSARFFLKNCLPEDQGYEIHEAQDGQEGLKKFKEVLPDITFSDVTMPEMDGFEMLKEIKTFKEDAIVIMLTADIQKKTTEKLIDAGALKVLKKPPVKDEIVEALLKG